MELFFVCLFVCFDITLDYKESKSLFKLLLDTSETGAQQVLEVYYDNDTVSWWDEYTSNNTLFNQHTGCQKE